MDPAAASAAATRYPCRPRSGPAHVRRQQPTRSRSRHPHRSAGAPDLWRLPAAGPAAQRAAAAVQPAAPRRDALHHPAPDLGAVAEAARPRAARGDRLPAAR
ncbi:hypothetical protein G6F31_017619 [Rhizopus arrhizus]|nr:hypothetical protein G6F32_016822 [Rhizopus arrhizus]KAG0928701.1 hypothetical protein G6F31_017619 [Rhizopus arrhizus]